MENTVTSVTALPDWLQDNLQDNNSAPVVSTKTTLRELELLTYGNVFESALERITMGEPLTSIVESDQREISYTALLRWIMKDPIRKARYYEAHEIGTEFIAADMIRIADADNSLEDVQRSTLRINTRKYLLGAWNKKRYAEVKQVEHSGGISIATALAEANARAFETYDGESEVIDAASDI